MVVHHTALGKLRQKVRVFQASLGYKMRPLKKTKRKKKEEKKGRKREREGGREERRKEARKETYLQENPSEQQLKKKENPIPLPPKFF
jgi:hypothetical protein